MVSREGFAIWKKAVEDNFNNNPIGFSKIQAGDFAQLVEVVNQAGKQLADHLYSKTLPKLSEYQLTFSNVNIWALAQFVDESQLPTKAQVDALLEAENKENASD